MTNLMPTTAPYIIHEEATKRIKHIPMNKLHIRETGGAYLIEGYLKRVYKKTGRYTWTCVSEEFVAYPVEA